MNQRDVQATRIRRNLILTRLHDIFALLEFHTLPALPSLWKEPITYPGRCLGIL
jgi:hypothetical protein